MVSEMVEAGWTTAVGIDLQERECERESERFLKGSYYRYLPFSLFSWQLITCSDPALPPLSVCMLGLSHICLTLFEQGTFIKGYPDRQARLEALGFDTDVSGALSIRSSSRVSRVERTGVQQQCFQCYQPSPIGWTHVLAVEAAGS